MLDKDLQEKIIKDGRTFSKSFNSLMHLEDVFESDQDLKKQQPPLCKEAVTPLNSHIKLSMDFDDVIVKRDIFEVIKDRKSNRAYTLQNMSLTQLSFLLWSTQGIKDIRGKSYATIRTVPCGGARHEFETYLVVKNVEGLKQGVYHYLPLEHSLEYLKEITDIDDKMNKSMCGQNWACKANVIFYWSMVPYRAEWRYGIYAHRVALIDSGHICQNLYLACTALKLGTCGVGAVDDALCNELFNLDGDNEYVVYSAPVGTIDESKNEEKIFYNFVYENNL